MVAAHMTSKEIARALKISPYTVDQRLDAARRKLNVTSRKEAALLFAQSERESGLSEGFVYEPKALASNAIPVAVARHTATDGAFDTADISGHYDLRQSRNSILALRLNARLSSMSFHPLGGERHDLTRLQIALLSLKIAFYCSVMLAATIAITIGTMRLF